MRNPEVEVKTPDPPRKQNLETEVKTPDLPRKQNPKTKIKTPRLLKKQNPVDTPRELTKQIGEPITSITPLQST